MRIGRNCTLNAVRFSVNGGEIPNVVITIRVNGALVDLPIPNVVITIRVNGALVDLPCNLLAGDDVTVGMVFPEAFTATMDLLINSRLEFSYP